jgi:hypothetical protein
MQNCTAKENELKSNKQTGYPHLCHIFQSLTVNNLNFSIFFSWVDDRRDPYSTPPQYTPCQSFNSGEMVDLIRSKILKSDKFGLNLSKFNKNQRIQPHRPELRNSAP